MWQTTTLIIWAHFKKSNHICSSKIYITVTSMSPSTWMSVKGAELHLRMASWAEKSTACIPHPALLASSAASTGDSIPQLQPTPARPAVLLEWFFLFGELKVYYFPLQVVHGFLSGWFSPFEGLINFSLIDVNKLKGLGKEVITEPGVGGTHL